MPDFRRPVISGERQQAGIDAADHHGSPGVEVRALPH